MALLASCGERGSPPAPPGLRVRVNGSISLDLTPASRSSPDCDKVKLDGIVLQNPLRMGELGVKTLVQYLEKQTVEPRIWTGEALVTSETSARQTSSN